MQPPVLSKYLFFFKLNFKAFLLLAKFWTHGKLIWQVPEPGALYRKTDKFLSPLLAIYKS